MIYTGSCIPDRVCSELKSQFPNLSLVQSPRTFKVPKNLDFDSVTLDQEDKELEALSDFMKANAPQSGQATVIFCEKKSRVDKVSEALKQVGVLSLPYEE